MKYDVIIIGSGFGGLVCGSLLSREGKRVLVLERQAQPGGCLQHYRRDSYTFDTGFHYVGGLADGQRLQRIFSYLGLMQLPWHRLDPTGFDLVTIGQHTFEYVEGYSAFAECMAQHFPHERQALQQYVGMLRRTDELFLGTDEMLNHYGLNAYDYLAATFTDPLLINVLSGTAMKMELRRRSLPLFAFAHGHSSYIQSSWRLRGDGGMIADALVAAIRANGGEVVCRAEASEFLGEYHSLRVNQRLTTVRCKSGEQYQADAFISDIHPSLTFALIKEGNLLKNIFRKRINALENTFGMFTVSLVLKPKSLPYFNHNKFVYLKPNVWSFHEDVGGVGGVMISARVPQSGSSYTEQVDLLTPMPWLLFKRWSTTSVGHRGDDYTAMKERLADACIRLAERVVPGLSSMVSQRYTSTPLTWHNYTLTPDGSAYGVRKDCRNLLLTTLSPRTPVPNLLLTGQNLMLHGLEGVTMTALLTCAELLGGDYIQKVINSQ